jgi:hypothetical protein
MMVLSRVYYELFDWEAEWLDANPACDAVQLGRQLRLEMIDQSKVFVAWNWERGGNSYFVDHGNKSFCTEDEITIREVSNSSIWKSLVGKPIELSYVDAQRQVLCIRSADDAVFCCSFEKGFWFMDELTIGRQLPSALPGEGNS